MKRGGPAHPKTLALAAVLGVDRWGAIGILESLFHWAAVYARRGDIGRHPNAAIAKGIDWTGDADKLVSALTHCGWFDTCCERHRLRIHDWPAHADQSVHRTKEVQDQGFIRCFKTRRKLVPDEQPNAGAELDAAGTGNGTGKRHRAQGTGAVKKCSPELERLLSNPEVLALSELWVQELGGQLALGVARAAQRCLAGGYPHPVAAQAILAIKTCRAKPDTFPPKSLARWSIEHNSKPDWVLRPEKVEELAAEFVKYGQLRGVLEPPPAQETPRQRAEREARQEREARELEAAAAVFTDGKA